MSLVTNPPELNLRLGFTRFTTEFVDGVFSFEVGCLMKSNKSFLLAILVPALALGSCYHYGGGGGGGGGGGNTGTTFLNLTVTSAPSLTFSFPSLVWPIGDITLIDASGNAISLGGSTGVAFPDFTRLQTDSLYLGHTTVTSTTYSSLKVQLNAPLSGYFYNSSNGATLLGCAAGTVCLIPPTVPGYGATTVTVPITYKANSASAGIRVNFDLSKAVTAVGGMTFDFTQTGAITLTALPTPSSQTAGIDTVDNFTGAVTAVTGTTVTVTSYSSAARTFKMALTVVFNDPLNICPPPASFSCLAVNQNVSLDGYINASDGSFSATEVEFLDPAPVASELEGVIITPVTNNQFKMVLTNGMGPANLIVGSVVTVNLGNAEPFAVDPKNLGVSTSLLGFLGPSDLVLGQTVMLQGGTIGTNTSLNNSTRVLLRYSSIGGTVQTPAGTIFSLASPSFTALASGSSLGVQTYVNATTYDNITGFSGLSSLPHASVRGLYLNPTSGAIYPLLAAKVRTH